MEFNENNDNNNIKVIVEGSVLLIIWEYSKIFFSIIIINIFRWGGWGLEKSY